MATVLRQVLERFEQQSGSVSLAEMARELGVERPMLQEMIDYWVRRGRVREVSGPDCPTCDCAKGCPFVVDLPRYYEPVSPADASQPPRPRCQHD